jgi:simple sugar transport system permease protein
VNNSGTRRFAIPSVVIGALLSMGAAAALATLIIAVASPDPGATLEAFFIGPWRSAWFLGNTLDGVALLLTASLGTALAFRGGCFNLGGEGQIYLGGLAASVTLLAAPAGATEGAALGLLCLAGLAALTAGGLLGILSGWLKKRFAANELITSFLISAALSPVADYLIAGPLRNPTGNLMATARFAVTLKRILPPSNLSVSLVFALILAGLGHVFMYRTVWGYRYRVSGSAPDFARYGGINPERRLIPAMGVSAALNGLAGFFAVAGSYGLCHRGFSGGLGWNAIAVALIARNRPLALIPAALVFGCLKAGSDSALLSRGLSFETTAFIQAAALILATIHFSTPLVFRRGAQKPLAPEPEPEPEPEKP